MIPDQKQKIFKSALQWNSFSCTNGIKICQFKAKDSKTEPYPFFLDTISKTFTVNNIKKAVLNGYVYGSL